ncbi:hypothetical protein JIN85_12735 [Luteolibacter pohnpeiensis]|uniref:S1-like domain-containing protein n=1 Tax=Luteolibacter pohnpeiensis TaxID=454153 RepID=A0A934S547_9BACT|nr:hypothetical protein [Luteolibacter pohnpeiensis]MBK1883285.1 hypothetical protein [Luteolibacter pohnpeiensis]
MPDATIHAVALLTEVLGPILYRAELPNGKRIMAHLSKPLTDAKAEFSIGQRVVVELTPFDFDSARILRLEDSQPAE